MYYQNLKKAVTVITKSVIPHNHKELQIFIVSFLWFLIFSSFFSFLVDFNERDVELMGYDTKFYIEGDNPKLTFSKLLSWNFRHPLYVLINLPSMIIDLILPKTFHVFVYALSSCVLSALNNLLIFKIISHIGGKTNYYISSIFVIILYSTFAHVILLSAQAETFIYTQFFLLLFILLTILNLSTSYTDNILFAFLTGTTLTNCIKFFLIKLCDSNFNIKKTLTKTLRSSYIFIILFLSTFLGLVYRIFYKNIPIGNAIFNDTMKFIHNMPNRLYLAWNNFFSEPLLFHSSKNVVYTKDSTTLDPYPSIIFHGIILFILLFSLIGLVKNRKKMIGKICFLCFSCDCFIHFIMGYGLNELHLFCGHWMFFIPICCALSLNDIQSDMTRKVFITIIFIISLFFASYNSYCYLNSMFI